MAVGPVSLEFFPVPGVRLAATAAGLKKSGGLDAVLFEFAPESRTAGIFTRSLFAAAPVQVARDHLQRAAPRYFLINSGNANAATGQAGVMDAETCCSAVSQQTGSSPDETIPFSTGVIGERLPVERLTNAISQLRDGLDENNWLIAATGIMTTDTRPKIASRRFNVEDKTVTITGIAKGAGMIAPNMATMLAYVATDAAAEAGLLQDLLTAAGERSFNRITVDSDTSTNDACMLTATGVSGVDLSDDAALAVFVPELDSLMLELAQGLVRDGEGATKFVTVTVEGGASESDCLGIAFSIANSPLMKTALFASDANWGRIVMAIGKAGVPADPARIDVYLGDVCLMKGGGKNPDYREEQGAAVMTGEEITIRVDLNSGTCSGTVWTSDLSHDYVTINADYRT
ncbi:MAG: bifunctional glutamate N-acetyltransferase/amino-acid acetyltransferase ArgJ [Proteobacteria bacterium]|jgi:glutamate N-acetyltransferase/amino-acid N-acetyltransferase|nr:bifunctional glutamate N-acetyltransferase/amino-acid acetyltransferase ArgJ [Pseudomonadota bacterium]MDA1299084.1 bifunctional glutamate N-acetyltransferase/amino-acid acetyltransferase ArgJ [Pseudomonadota bacterium]